MSSAAISPTDLSIVSIRNNILHDATRASYKLQIVDRIKQLNVDVQKYAHDPEMVLLVCNIIEYLVRKSDAIDKKSLAVEVFEELLGPLTEVHKDLISNSIEFLHANRNIKRVSFWKCFKAGFREWFSPSK